MKIRTSFVTNSSSSSFIVNMKNYSWNKIMDIIKNPENYIDQYLEWVNKTYEYKLKDNPNNIPEWRHLTEQEAIDKYFGGKRPDDSSLALKMRWSDVNPDYEALPEKPFDREWFDENRWLCDHLGWSISADPDHKYLKFYTFMDNFDWKEYLTAVAVNTKDISMLEIEYSEIEENVKKYADINFEEKIQ